jgi:hypothetical protein
MKLLKIGIFIKPLRADLIRSRLCSQFRAQGLHPTSYNACQIKIFTPVLFRK